LCSKFYITKTLKPFYLIALLLFVLTAGMKCKDKLRLNTPKEELPAITQEGRNTFGFLLNGEVWLPKGPLLRRNLDISFYDKGRIGIVAKRSITEKNVDQYISISSENIENIGEYPLFVYYNDHISNCNFNERNIVGVLKVTRIDLNNKIISGTFSFKVEIPGCSTINATEGRFDLKRQ
jgi:hypothetical protein